MLVFKLKVFLRLSFLLFFRLDTILGKAGSKSVDVYDSKFSLASRIVKVERSVSINYREVLICFYASLCYCYGGHNFMGFV